MLLGLFHCKFLLQYFPLVTNEFTWWGDSFKYCELYPKWSNVFHNYMQIKNTGITNFSYLKI